jgi:isopentenyl-diphosphate delta-isomerase
MNDPMLIHVDKDDQIIGLVPKLQAHQEGLLHRAVSVLIFNSKGEWLLQKRAHHKYHSGGLWSNSCCSHPFPDEEVKDAAERRLREEMGLDCSLTKMLVFTYYAELDNDLIEYEIDHLFIGISNELPVLNEDEVAEFQYISSEDLKNELSLNPDQFTEWFKIIHDRFSIEKDTYVNELVRIAS